MKTLIVCAVLLAVTAHADITFDRGANTILVAGFPEEAPAVMQDILAADQRHGWDKVTHERSGSCDTYRIGAALWIGNDKNNGTFLQVGDREHTNVSVIVKGSVWVRPAKHSMRRRDGRYAVLNRLTLGHAKDEHIRATLEFACDEPGQHGLYVGLDSKHRDKVPNNNRASLHVYNSVITAAFQDKQHVWGVYRDYSDELHPAWHGSDMRLINATLSWYKGCVTYGAVSGIRPGVGNAFFNGTTFEHGGDAVRNGRHYFRNCVFRHLETALAEGGGLKAELVGCTLEANERNWTVGGHAGRGITMVDCRVGPQKEPICLRKNKPTAAQARRGIPFYPSCVMRESLLVKVVNADEKPVPTAMVLVSCDQGPGRVTRGACVTDREGLTPSDPEKDAIVVTTRTLRATDDPETPKESVFGFRVDVSAVGYEARAVALPAGQPLARPLVVTLAREP